MIISIDYDDTYTRDPEIWNQFCEMLINKGHVVVCISSRYPQHMDEVKNTLGKVIGESFCFGTSHQPKKQWMVENLDIWVDVWVDDIPEMIA